MRGTDYIDYVRLRCTRPTGRLMKPGPDSDFHRCGNVRPGTWVQEWKIPAFVLHCACNLKMGAKHPIRGCGIVVDVASQEQGLVGCQPAVCKRCLVSS